jgi:hypothetical protein
MTPVTSSCPMYLADPSRTEHQHRPDPGCRPSTLVVPEPRQVTRTEAVAAYERAWSRPDETAIGAELERCWTSRSTHVSPITDMVTGVAGLTRLILDVPIMFPGAHFRLTAPTDFHHDSARLAWRLESTARIRMSGHDFGFTAEGLDYLELDPQNRIRRVVTFVGNSG